jgi:hypothetical protein
MCVTKGGKERRSFLFFEVNLGKTIVYRHSTHLLVGKIVQVYGLNCIAFQQKNNYNYFIAKNDTIFRRENTYEIHDQAHLGAVDGGLPAGYSGPAGCRSDDQ